MMQRVVDSAIYRGTRAVAATRVGARYVAVPPEAAFVSFTFDDFPRSARTRGARVLADYGARGTFYAAMSKLTASPAEGEGFSADDLVALAREAQELGCHTHAHLDCFLASDRQIVDDVNRNADAVARVLPDVPLRQFAFPYGRLRPAHKALLGARFQSLRSIFPGVHRGRADLHLLRANKIFSSGGFVDRAVELVDDVAARGGWVVFFTHDVSDRPSPYGVTPSDLARVVSRARHHTLRMLPVGEVIARLGG